MKIMKTIHLQEKATEKSKITRKEKDTKELNTNFKYQKFSFLVFLTTFKKIKTNTLK